MAASSPATQRVAQQDLKGTVVKSLRQFRTSDLPGVDPARQYFPDFFLASVSHISWLPALVVIQDDRQKIVTILYAKERKFLGFATGLFYADATLASLLSTSDNSSEILATGLRALLSHPRFRGLRLLAPPAGLETHLLHALADSHNLDIQTTPIQCHLTLALTPTYQAFLDRLSSRTRRNFRYYRNRSAEAGHVYVEGIHFAEFSSASWALQAHAPVGVKPEALQRALNMFQHAQRPLLVGLRSSDGELISLIGGWYENNRVVIFMQINSDKRHARFSLSLVLRTYLIESLIRQGVPEILWWAGASEPISNYCTSVPSVRAYVDSRKHSWRLLRSVVGYFSPRLSPRLQEVAQWVLPLTPKNIQQPNALESSSTD